MRLCDTILKFLFRNILLVLVAVALKRLQSVWRLGHGFCALIAGPLLIAASTAADAQNLMSNPGFEDNPPSSYGNNTGHSIAPWIVTGASGTNVVKVDGPGGFNYGNSGAESDLSAPGAGIDQPLPLRTGPVLLRN